MSPYLLLGGNYKAMDLKPSCIVMEDVSLDGTRQTRGRSAWA